MYVYAYLHAVCISKLVTEDMLASIFLE
jgi:hypothetical protein